MPPAVAAPLSASALGAGASAAGAVDDNMQSFPAIAPDEAANVITLELGEPVSVEDIAKPTAAFVMRVFCTFLLSLSGISEEDMLQRRDEMISTMEYPVSCTHARVDCAETAPRIAALACERSLTLF